MASPNGDANQAGSSDGGADNKHAPGSSSSAWRGADEVNKVVATLLAGPLVWGVAGWLADLWLGTTPWLLAAGVLLGAGAAFYLVWRSSVQGD